MSRSHKILQDMCWQDFTRSWQEITKILARSYQDLVRSYKACAAKILQDLGTILARSYQDLLRYLNKKFWQDLGGSWQDFYKIMAGSCQDIVKSCGKQDLGKIIHDLGKILPRFNQDKILPRSYKILGDLTRSWGILQDLAKVLDMGTGTITFWIAWFYIKHIRRVLIDAKMKILLFKYKVWMSVWWIWMKKNPEYWKLLFRWSHFEGWWFGDISKPHKH